MINPINIYIYPEVRLHQVNRYLYSHFIENLGSCAYDGIWVGEDMDIKNDGGIRCDVAEAFKRISVPIIRWPGGCFADNYHWMDGIGPRKLRPRRYNIWWEQLETNYFGTDEFMHLCEMIEAEPYLCLNIGSGTVEEARSWVEYCNYSHQTTLANLRKQNGHTQPYNVKYWGLGNENWGCGGNLRPEYYADLYRRFATYVKRTAGEDTKLIAVGSYQGLQDWDERFLTAMRGAYTLVDSIALHIYLGVGTNDLDFLDDDYYRLIASIDILERELSRAIGLAQAFSMYGHKIDVVMDEWGTCYRQATVEAGLCQQNTMQDAIFTAACFHRFHKLGDRLWMTNKSEAVNTLQTLIFTKGTKMILTPTYYVYELFRPHHDGYLVPCEVTNIPVFTLPDKTDHHALSICPTISIDGKELFLSILNFDLSHTVIANIQISDASGWKVIEVRRLGTRDIHSHNTFENPYQVQPEKISNDKFDNLSSFHFPSQSITTLRLKRSGI
jgi:alpha-N-arabinofuranosidase